ncbi:MAG TPA: ABC transporter ATP-binding protein [Stellaceae bacterium]|nr:ABC transporter ATP-binding protein [Stellaceae bacterium]
MTATVLAVEHLGTEGDAGVALADVSLAVGAGEVVALLGANGAGKSTLLRAIMGMVPACGSLRLGGRELAGSGPAARARRGIGYVPEGRRLFAGMSVRDNLLVGSLAGRDAARQRLDEVLGVFPALAERLATPAWQLSGGQQQMLAIGRALMGAPILLLLDEPSLGLAPMLVQELLDRVRDLARRGTAVLLAEQSVARALALADRVYALRRGHIAGAGTPGALRASGILEHAFLGADVALSNNPGPGGPT